MDDVSTTACVLSPSPAPHQFNTRQLLRIGRGVWGEVMASRCTLSSFTMPISSAGQSYLGGEVKVSIRLLGLRFKPIFNIAYDCLFNFSKIPC
jgi:hypothetical protein